VIRYGLLGFSHDILEVRQLATAGGVGPLGPKFERMYWSEEQGEWVDSLTESSGESGKPSD
jgi:hypothetical protein